MNHFTSEEIEILAKGGATLRRILDSVAAMVKPGVTGLQLNAEAERLIAQSGARPAFKGYGRPPYPHALCVSVNDCVVHGIANDQPLQAGDIVSLDCGVEYLGFFTDAAITVPVGHIDQRSQKLIKVTAAALQRALSRVKAGMKTGELGSIIQAEVEKNGFGIVREYTGHGVGRSVHAEPSVPNYGKPEQGTLLTEGMVIAIEPMVTAGDWRVRVTDNHWDVVTIDGSRAAHFEHTVAITKDGCRVLTQ